MSTPDQVRGGSIQAAVFSGRRSRGAPRRHCLLALSTENRRAQFGSAPRQTLSGKRPGVAFVPLRPGSPHVVQLRPVPAAQNAHDSLEYGQDIHPRLSPITTLLDHFLKVTLDHRKEVMGRQCEIIPSKLDGEMRRPPQMCHTCYLRVLLCSPVFLFRVASPQSHGSVPFACSCA
jgi:hypothetical protein